MRYRFIVAHSGDQEALSGLTPHRVEGPQALSPLRATAIVGVGSLVSMAVTVAVAKALAVLTGPVGVGLYGLMQSVVGLTVMIVGLGVSAGLVRGVAAAAGAGDHRRAAALTRAAWVMATSGAVVALVLLAATREAVATYALGSPGRSNDVILLGVAVGLTLLGGVPISSMTGRGRIRALTVTAIVSSVAGGIMAVALVWLFHVDGLSVAVVTTLAVGLIVAVGISAKVESPTDEIPATSHREVFHAAGSLFRFGLPYTASAVVGVGAQLVIPVLVLNQLDSQAVGIYRASATISVGYIAFIVASIAQDFYPRLAAASPSAVVDLVERRMRLVLALAVPLILLTLGIAPLVIEALYSSEFREADRVLRWQLVGDLLKLPAAVLAFVLLARAGASWYLLAELIGGAGLIIATVLCIEQFGIEGAGIAYLVSFAIYYLAVWLLAHRWAPTTPGRLQAVVVALVVLCIAGNVFMGGSELAPRGAVFVAAALVAALIAIPRLLQHHRNEAL